MLTDRSPSEYLYLSRRLLTDLFMHEEATSSRTRMTFDITVPFLRVHVQRRAPNLDNLRDLARRSSELVSDQTGTIADPGYYIGGECQAHLGVFSPLMGWREGKIACLRIDVANGDDERTVVALFGSARNVVGWRGEDELETDFHPSDAAGLYSIIDAARERDDPEVDLEYRWDDAALSDEARADAALMLARAGARRPVGRVKFLAKVFQEFDQRDLRGESVDRLIVGAPIWVATGDPRPLG